MNNEIELKVSLEDLFYQRNKNVFISRQILCKSCYSIDCCIQCSGQGINIRGCSGPKKIICIMCEGTGYKTIKDCKSCNGSRLANEELKLVVPITHALKTGDIIDVDNVRIKIIIKKHPHFELEDNGDMVYVGPPNTIKTIDGISLPSSVLNSPNEYGMWNKSGKSRGKLYARLL